VRGLFRLSEEGGMQAAGATCTHTRTHILHDHYQIKWVVVVIVCDEYCIILNLTNGLCVNRIYRKSVGAVVTELHV
jgi:nitrite reductase/ring-hydroxylating ferredoxin subunit